MSISITVRARIKEINKGEYQLHLDSKGNYEYYKDTVLFRPVPTPIPPHD